MISPELAEKIRRRNELVAQVVARHNASVKSAERAESWKRFWWEVCGLPGGQWIYWHLGYRLTRRWLDPVPAPPPTGPQRTAGPHPPSTHDQPRTGISRHPTASPASSPQPYRHNLDT